MKFFNNDIYSESGSNIEILYTPHVNEDGSIDLIESGKKDIQEEIQSYLESCDINVIISRVLNGESELLNQRKAMYGDFTNMPKTYAEMLQLQINSKQLFDALPIDVKEKFDNDVNKFFASAGTEEWIDKCGFTIPKETKEVLEKNIEEKKGD